MKVKVNITREVILKSAYCGHEHEYPGLFMDAAIKPTGEKCLIAVAIRELVPFAIVSTEFTLYPLSCSLDRDCIDFERGGIEAVRNTSEIVQIISRFDRMTPSQRLKYIKPFSFEIDIPDRVIELIGIQEVDKILEHAKYLEKV